MQPTLVSRETDKEQMSALVHAFPADNLHLADLPYRLSSWAFDHPENIGLWFDDDQHLIAWAVLQTPFWAIDYAYHPIAAPNIHGHILAWADAQARNLLNTPAGRPIWFLNVFNRQTDRITDLEAAGFACQADVGENSWSKLLMVRQAQAPIPDNPLPEGFTIRPLAGEAEVSAYVALHRTVFESNSMTELWRQWTLKRPEYSPQLDLVVVAPDQSLAAFCVGWLDQAGSDGQPGGQIEPLGVHPQYRGLGFGKAILSEGLRRLRDLGAAQIFVETDNYRNAALSLYESAGFQVKENVLVYRKDYEG